MRRSRNAVINAFKEQDQHDSSDEYADLEGFLVADDEEVL